MESKQLQLKIQDAIKEAESLLGQAEALAQEEVENFEHSAFVGHLRTVLARLHDAAGAFERTITGE